MKLFAVLFVFLIACVSFAGPGDILNISCVKVITGTETGVPNQDRQDPTDQTPVILATVAARQVDIDTWRELSSLNRARTVRLASNGLSESAMGTKIRSHIGNLMDLLDNGQKFEAIDQNLWIWDEVIRIYRINKENEQLISDATENMAAGRLRVEEGQELIGTLQREISENQVQYAEAFAYFRGVRGFLRNHAGETSEKSSSGKDVDPEATAMSGAAHAKVRALAPTMEVNVTMEMVAIEPPTPVEQPATVSAKTKEQRIQETAAYVYRVLNGRAKTFARMFPERGLSETMPTWQELSEYNRYSAQQNISYRQIEAKMDRNTSVKLFFLSGSMLAPARWAVKKFLPLTAQQYVFKVFKLGEDNATRIRYVPDIFNIFNVAPEKQIAELRDKNAPTDDQLLVAFARMFPRTYVRLMIKARDAGKLEAEALGEKIPEDLTVVPSRKERALSPQLNFYYRMVTALRAAQVRGDLSVDQNNNVGQRAAVYVAGGTALMGGASYTAYQNWETVQMWITAARAWMGF